MGLWQQIKEEVGDLNQEIWQGIRHLRTSWRNAYRQWDHINYVVMPLGGSLPERSGPPRSFWQRQLPLPADPLSMQMVNTRFHRFAEATNLDGVLILLTGLSTGFATLQNIRQSIGRLQAAGKKVVVYTPYLDNAHYFVASQADKIIVPPSAQFELFGLRSEAIFLRDALAKVGIAFDNIQISPYKTAADMFDKADMTPEFRAQVEMLLDEQYEILVGGLIEKRPIGREQMKWFIDHAPLTAQEALDNKLIDAIGYEDELAELLYDGPADVPGRPPARLLFWEEAWPMLTEKYRHPTHEYIGVISVEGMITMGQSSTPPVDLPIPFIGGTTAGEATLSQLIRRAEQDHRLAALILHVDSGGGSALASDLIGRQIQRLQQKKPVLVYMGNMAASGGYYISAYAQHIMTQPATLTGSIGVVMARPSTQGLYEKLSINRVAIQRGQRAHLYSDSAPLTTEERAVFEGAIQTVYRQFKQVVADGRKLPYDQLDRVALGRVWTGRQAKVHKLVDSHGDFVEAINKTIELAKLKPGRGYYVPVVNLFPDDDDYRLPQPFNAPQEWANLLSLERLKLFQEPLTLMPFTLRFW